MDDLIERLEELARPANLAGVTNIWQEAAATIRTLRAERDAAVQAEVAAIVAWLRTRWRERPDFLADLIECGEYKKTSNYD